MTDLRLISDSDRRLKPLVVAALENEMRLLMAGIRRTELNIEGFEKKFNLSTQEFLRRYENNEIDETLNFDEWIGEHQLLERLREKVATIRSIRFAS